ncbi:hypothetical protein OV090_41585 [Nannocystis sp. RBIL2]|uniref:hypothetical protein n=1 Tax=Nannocystis sp. RBIL2 TaxID=2996788 RepID=UPI0022719B50|nr:hypothetical protein [Nannocystis sp. RBIL2]MCY1071309.1 hypothetical protein [Nannocystis sp. RBIL2]
MVISTSLKGALPWIFGVCASGFVPVPVSADEGDPHGSPQELATRPRPSADESCRALVTEFVQRLKQDGGKYAFEMTIHSTVHNWVAYGKGTFQLSGEDDWPLVGHGIELFSDRVAGEQPFAASMADSIDPQIRSDGRLYIWIMPWAVEREFDMSCVDNVFTRVVPGEGVVSVSLREWSA